MQDAIRGFKSHIHKWLPEAKTATRDVQQVVSKEVEAVLKTPGMEFVRFAGLSGALAVAMGAYGAHVFRPEHKDPKIIAVFETGNRYHFIHTLALLAVPLTRRPTLVGSLFCAGMLLFSGSCYFHAITGNTEIRRATPIGGMLLIAAWLSILI